MTELPSGTLADGEKLLWTGGPDGPYFLRRLILRGAVVILVLYGVFTWVVPVLEAGGGSPVPPGLVVRILIVLPLVWLCWRMVVLSKRVYAITNRRALMWHREGEPRLRAVPIDPQTLVARDSGRRGRISFSPPRSAPDDLTGRAVRFEYLADLPGVADLVGRVQKGTA